MHIYLDTSTATATTAAMSTPHTPPDRSPASGLLTTKPLSDALPTPRADIDPAMLGGVRNGGLASARRCSLTLLSLCSPTATSTTSGNAAFPDAHAHAPTSPHPLRMHAVPHSTLLPFLQRPQEVAALLCDTRNAALLSALKASPAWEQVQRILAMQRDEMSDARWLAELKAALGQRGQHLCNDLMRCLGADDVQIDAYLDEEAMEDESDSDSEHEDALHRHDLWATQEHDTFASDESDDDEQDEEEEAQDVEMMSASDHALATSAVSVEALHALPDGWLGPQRVAFAAAQQAAASASATPSPETASPSTSRAAAAAAAGLNTADWSSTHDRRSSAARSLPDIQEEGATPSVEKQPPSFTQQVDDKLEQQQEQQQPGKAEATHHARHRRLSTSLDDAPREEIESILESGVVGLRFVTDMPQQDDVAAPEASTSSPSAAAATSPPTPNTPPHFKQHRRLSALFAPMTPISAPSAGPSMRSRSSSIAHSDTADDEHKGTRGVPLTSRRRLSFARSFAELAESRANASASAEASSGNVGIRRRHSVMSRSNEATKSSSKVARGRSNTTCGYTAPAADASSTPFAQRRHSRSHTSATSQDSSLSLIERAAALEAAGEEKPSWLGLLPDGRTRHPSAGSSKAGNATLEAFRASLGMARADSEAGSSAAGTASRSASGNTSPQPPHAAAATASTATTTNKAKDGEAKTSLTQTQSRAPPPAPLSTLPRKRSGSGGMGIKSPPLQPATPLAPLQTPKRSPPSPTEASGFALGGGFSFGKSGEHYKPSPKPSPAAATSSDDIFDMSSPPLALPSHGSPAAAPSVHRRKGGFTTFSREYEKTQRARRVRAASATSVDSAAYSTGSQVVASDDDDYEAFSPFATAAPLQSHAQAMGLLSSPAAPESGASAPSPGARVSALGLSGMGNTASPASPKSATPTSPARSAPLAIPGRSVAHEEDGRPTFALGSDVLSPRRPSAAEMGLTGAGAGHGEKHTHTEKHVAWNVPSIAVSRTSEPSTPAYVPPSPTQACIRPSSARETLIFPIAPAHSRAVEMARLLRLPHAASALENARRVIGTDAVSRAVLLLSTTERSSLCDAALLERVAREAFGLVDHASTRAHGEAEAKMCEDGYAQRWEAFESFAKEACGVEEGVINEAKARCGPALCLFSSATQQQDGKDEEMRSINSDDEEDEKK